MRMSGRVVAAILLFLSEFLKCVEFLYGRFAEVQTDRFLREVPNISGSQSCEDTDEDPFDHFPVQLRMLEILT
jgi:hypothetical protein